MTAASASGV